MKKFLIIIISYLSIMGPVLSDQIDYKKTILNNKIATIYNNFAKHEFYFNETEVKWLVTKFDTKEIIAEMNKCWFQTEYINAFKIKDCPGSTPPILEHIFSLDLNNMTYRIQGQYDDKTYKISEPINIFYKP